MAKQVDLGAVTAYALAVKNGFVGTEQEWLASLKGEQGAQGTPGRDGKDGSPGVPGKDGKTPVRGMDYWTGQDKQEIVQDALEALPKWDGGAF